MFESLEHLSVSRVFVLVEHTVLRNILRVPRQTSRSNQMLAVKSRKLKSIKIAFSFRIAFKGQQFIVRLAVSIKALYEAPVRLFLDCRDSAATIRHALPGTPAATPLESNDWLTRSEVM